MSPAQLYFSEKLESSPISCLNSQKLPAGAPARIGHLIKKRQVTVKGHQRQQVNHIARAEVCSLDAPVLS